MIKLKTIKRNMHFLFLFLISFLICLISVNASLIYSEQWSWNLTGASVDPAIVFGDLNNDGYLDLITLGCALGTVDVSCSIFEKTKVYINNGTSLIENSTWEQNLTGSWETLALGDIDNDGDLDLIITNIHKVYINNGTSFEESSTWQQDLVTYDPSPSSIGLNDINNDGTLDIALTCFGGGKPSAYINNRTSFVGQYWIDNSWMDCRESVNLVDINNDGYLDLISAGNSYGALYINNRTYFTPIDSAVTSMDHVSSVAGDLDNDGDIDAIEMGLAAGDASRGLKNDGTTLIRNTLWEISGESRGSLSVGDYDNDGDLDLLRIGGDEVDIFDNNLSVFEANTTTSQSLITESSTSTAWIDIDNDKDLDLAIIYSGVIWIYINNITTLNIPPTSPTSFSSSYSNREIKLGWSNGSDAETPSLGLYYNLRVGNSTNNNSIISGVYGGSSNPTAGYFGNMMQRKNFTLKVDRLQPSTTYYWYVQTIDTGLKAGNWSAVQSFTTPADMEKPAITLNVPVDYYNSSSYTITFNATVFDNMNLSNVSLWGNWSGWHLNETNSSGLNNTNYIFTKNLSSYGDGSYTWMISAWDNASNTQNSSIRTFTIDTTYPQINITSPANNTNSSNNILNINYTRSDLNLQSCWYSNDTFAVNTSLGTAGVCTNITTVTWSEGQHNVIVWINDSVGNTNSSSVRFTIDSTYPLLSIVSPANNTNSTDNTLNINYTRSDANLQSCWYSNDTLTANTTLASCTNITTITWSEGTHNVKIWVNDSFGNTNSSSVRFTIDTTYPLISIVSPINDTNSTNNALDIKYTFTEANPSACWYSNDSYSVNTTLSCGTNITALTWSEGIHNVKIWINDSVGNTNSSSVRFTIDTTYPLISIVSPANNTNSSNNILNINYTRSDLNLQSCWYSNDTLTANTTLASCTNITAITWSEGTHNIKIWVNDSFGNTNSSSVRFTIDTAYPLVYLISPADGSSWTSSSSVTFSYNVSDVDIANCSLIIDNVLDQTDTTITEDTTQTFTKTISNAVYTWSINCTDYVGYTNNSANRSLTVSYTASSDTGNGGSSGGGGGITTTKNITTQPKQFDVDFSNVSSGSFEAKQGDIKIFSFNGEILHEIVISEIIKDSVRLIIKSEPIVLLIKSGEVKQVDINKDNLNDFEIKLVSILNGKASFSLKKLEGADTAGKEELEEAVLKKALFDVKVEIIDKFKEVFAGEEVSAKIEVFNINNIGQVDVVVNSYLSDNESIFGSGSSDTLAVEAVASFVRSLIIPDNLKPGIYYFNINVSYKNFTTFSKAEFKVKSKKLIFIENKWKEIVIIGIGAIALIVIAVFVYLWKINKKEEEIEKKGEKTEKKEARLERIIRKLRRNKK